jgi:hypothetical protein
MQCHLEQQGVRALAVDFNWLFKYLRVKNYPLSSINITIVLIFKKKIGAGQW